MFRSRFASFASFLTAVLVYCSLVASHEVYAQSIQMGDLPGWDLVQDASQARGKFNVKPDKFHWAGDTLYFSVKGKRQQLNLETGEISDAADEPKQESTASEGRRRGRQGVGRARQRTTIESEDGTWKASYKDFNIFVERIAKEGDTKSAPIAVTKTGTEKHRFGTACWVYGEELYQQDAMWFSPDSKKLVFYEIDESHMKTYFLTTRNTQVYTGLHKEQYPTAGQDNPHVILHIYDIATKETIPVKVDGPVDQYIYGIDFTKDKKSVLFHRSNRWQNEMEVMAADLSTGESRVVVAEKQDTWQNNSPLMRFLEDGERFIWETERTGWKQYELRKLDGTKVCNLTPDAEYAVHQVVKVDEEAGWFYYSAYSDENPLNLQFHRSRLDGTENARLTTTSMNHTGFRVSPDNKSFIASYESVSTPPSTAVWKMDMESQKIATLVVGDSSQLVEAGFVPGELFSFPSADGKETIYGSLFKPRDFDSSKKYPLLIDVYGGPSSVGLTNRFSSGNPYCEMGFIVAKIGNRGTTNRGKAFESATYLELGILDLDDQAEGVRVLGQRGYIDADRVGIYGHSYGGYMSALALLRYPDLFHVGVAGAPVTDWKNYDTIYTERYMRTPKENKQGYEAGSCMKHASELQGKLFILHGLVDDNVHPSNTWQLVGALQAAGKRFDMMVYPDSAHGFRYNELKWEYFVRHLKPEVKQTRSEDN